MKDNSVIGIVAVLLLLMVSLAFPPLFLVGSALLVVWLGYDGWRKHSARQSGGGGDR